MTELAEGEMADSQVPRAWYLPHRRTWVVLFVIVLVCLVMDLVPRQGPPDFRYTGSDPERTVTNIGWPLGLFIYDGDVSPHWFGGPFAYIIPPVQMVVALVVSVVVEVVRRMGTRARLWGE